MKKAIPLLSLLALLAIALLMLISSVLASCDIPSPFLIAATIVSVVALSGALFSLYTDHRVKNRIA